MKPVTRHLALVSCGYPLCQELCVFVFRGVKPPPKPVSVQAIFGVMGCTRLGGAQQEHLDAPGLLALAGMVVKVASSLQRHRA